MWPVLYDKNSSSGIGVNDLLKPYFSSPPKMPVVIDSIGTKYNAFLYQCSLGQSTPKGCAYAFLYTYINNANANCIQLPKDPFGSFVVNGVKLCWYELRNSD
jgi:hypothetical protein